MKLPSMPYPCIGYCIIDKRGYCVACGRPPNLGMPDECRPGERQAAPAPASPQPRVIPKKPL